MEEQKLKQLVRISNTDINGNKNIYIALRKIKGISFSFSNAMLNELNINKNKKAGLLSLEEIQKIEGMIKNPSSLPKWLFNRRSDPETGENNHIVGPTLKLKNESDIKSLKKIKSYRGIRHSMGQPSRGQRTRSHFRKGTSLGVNKKKLAPQKKVNKKE